MRFTGKDVLASGLVGTAVAVYLVYLAFDGFLFVDEVPAMAGVGLALGFLSRRIGGRAGFAHERVAFAAGLASMALGIAALVTESEAVLALFMLSMVGLWAAAMLAHSGSTIGNVRTSH